MLPKQPPPKAMMIPPSDADDPLADLPLRFSPHESHVGKRIDQVLSRQFPQISRAMWQRAISAGSITLNDQPTRPADKLAPNDVVTIHQVETPRPGPIPQKIDLDVLHEDDAIVVINKPAGMVVHPAKGHWEGTLASALAHHFGQLSQAGGPTRPGIVHRLDRDTTGVIVIAKTDQAHHALAKQFHDRTVRKEYLAIVGGHLDLDGEVVNQPIGDHPTQREKKALRADHESSREATTIVEVLERFPKHLLVRARPKTGRTHQIRLHLTHLGCPVLCDRLYGGRSQITAAELSPNASPPDSVVLSRQALHAERIEIVHPLTMTAVAFSATLPVDFESTLAILRRQ